MRVLAPRFLALLVITAIAVYLCWLMVEPFFQTVVWAAVLAIVSYPIYQRLIRRGRSPGVAAVLTTVLVVLTVVVPLTLLGLILVREMADAVPALHEGISKLIDPNAPVRQWIDRHVELGSVLDPKFVEDRLKALSGTIAKEVFGIVGDIFGTAVQGFFVLFTLYYLLRDADQIIAVMRRFIPLEAAETDRVMRQTHEIISASLHGTLTIAAIQGGLGWFAFIVLHLPSPLVWGVVMFFLSMIPMAGAFIVWVPAACYLFVTGQWTSAMLLTLWGSLVIGTIDNFLRPRLVGQRTRLHELVVLFSVLGGLKVFGMLGLVVGPVVVAITLALIDVLRHTIVVAGPNDQQVSVATAAVCTGQSTPRSTSAAPEQS